MNLLKTRFFRHYKNKPYRYLGIVKHSETLEDLVLYETLYENKTAKLWVRPKEMFFEDIMLEGIKTPRFKPVEFTFKEFTQLDDNIIEAISEIYDESLGAQFDLEIFKSRLNKFEKTFGLIAFDGDQAVAMKIGYKQNSETFYSWLGGVKKAYSGLGLATELMRRQHEWCLSQGFKIIETRSRHPYIDMMKLNLSFGFHIVGTVADNKKYPKVIFQKELS